MQGTSQTHMWIIMADTEWLKITCHPRGWLPYWTRPFIYKTRYKFMKCQMTFFSPSSEGLLRLETKYRGSHLEEGIKTFRLVPNLGWFLCFSRHHSCVFCVAFVPIPLTRIGVLFCLYSFSSVSVKMSSFYFRTVINVKCWSYVFSFFWERSMRPVGSLKFDCVILQVLPNRPSVLRLPGRLPTTSFLACDYK